MDLKTLENMGIEDHGKWLPFIFDMDIVEAAKLSSDESDSPTYNCTSIFTKSGDTYIIDTPPHEFFKKFIEWNTVLIDGGGGDNTLDEDLEL
jgi:Na+-transporting NADH:ubiquinone oxidoreductase subunit NqrF